MGTREHHRLRRRPDRVTIFGESAGAGFVADATGAGGVLAAYASLADHFELLGYIVVVIFAASWLSAAAIWRYRGLAEKYGDRQGAADDVPQRT